MALVTRLSRLFQADFHAVLDRIEEPDLQLRQAVREMQFALDQDQQRLQLLQHEATRLDEACAAAAINPCSNKQPTLMCNVGTWSNRSKNKISNSPA